MTNSDKGLVSAGHTPGPWLAASRPSSVSGLPIVATPSGRSIACVTYFELGEAFANHDRESAANARLIAAAPELLEALQTVRDYVADAHNGYALFDGRPLDKGMTGDDLARIDAAIAKAMGEA